jgi:hypothetical protein
MSCRIDPNIAGGEDFILIKREISSPSDPDESVIGWLV